MKKISLLKKVGIGIGSVAATIPLVLTATSCSNTSAVVSNYISFDKIREDNSLVNMQQRHCSNNDILLGTNKFYNGNYILFVGSNTFRASKSFFTGQIDPQEYPPMDISKWFGDLFIESLWYADIHNYPNLSLLNTDFGFVTFIDDFDRKFYDEDGREYWVSEDDNQGWLGIKEDVQPFETWTNQLIVTTNAFMKKLEENNVVDYDWDEEAVKEGDFIRQDKQAKAYREFCKRGLQFFPTNEQRTQSFVTDNSDGSLMVIYKGGKLQEIVKIPANKNTKSDDDKEKDKDTATLLGAINKYYADIEDDPDPK